MSSPRRQYKIIGTLVREGYAHLIQEEYEQARVAFLTALDYRDQLKRFGLLDYVLQSLDVAWLFQERYQEEITFFSQYIRRYPEDAAAHCARAGALWYSGELEKAVERYSQILERQPANFMARSGRGQVLAEFANPQEALDELDLALTNLRTSTDSSNANLAGHHKQFEGFIHRGRGVALARLGKDEAAMAEFAKSIALAPDNAWVYYSRAQVCERLGRHQQASADYRMAMEKRKPPLTPLQRANVDVRLPNLQA